MINKETKYTTITFSFCMLEKYHGIPTNIPGGNYEPEGRSGGFF